MVSLDDSRSLLSRGWSEGRLSLGTWHCGELNYQHCDLIIIIITAKLRYYLRVRYLPVVTKLAN